MEDTILPDETYAYKSQPLRVTFKNIDYEVRILNKDIKKTDTSVKILLDGIVQTLEKAPSHWRFSGSDDDPAFAQAIWHSISLRYRL
ncbi:hypothetical protein [Olivibacter sp. XZL3]|uniref:hypothetical protein n=1 Tax=Olivibacter sp. XZL3 TaxID=1735116 RepID=UPI001065EAD2|nr:hypothetical protein [Olivibacter sp. XZL3]